MTNLILHIDMDSAITQRKIFDIIWNVIFCQGFDFVLDNGLLVKFTGFQTIGDELWIGPNPEALLSKAQNVAFESSNVNCYTIDMQDISYTQLFTRIEDITCSMGFYKLFKNSFQVAIKNRQFGKSNNHILYIGPYKE